MTRETPLAIDTVGILSATRAVTRRSAGDTRFSFNVHWFKDEHLRITIPDCIGVDITTATARFTRSPHARNEAFGIAEVTIVAVLASVTCSETTNSAVVSHEQNLPV